MCSSTVASSPSPYPSCPAPDFHPESSNAAEVQVGPGSTLRSSYFQTSPNLTRKPAAGCGWIANGASDWSVTAGVLTSEIRSNARVVSSAGTVQEKWPELAVSPMRPQVAPPSCES